MALTKRVKKWTKQSFIKASSLLLAFTMMASGAPVAHGATSETFGNSQAPKYVFYFIGDGMGSEQKQITEYYLQHQAGNDSERLTFSNFPVVGLNSTHSQNNLVTDSAAAATSLATGFKTDSGMIAQQPDGTNLETVLERAMDHGMATGLVTTTRLTHATPAAFASHQPSRNMESEIADDYLGSGVNYLAGGGARYFVGDDCDIVGVDGKTIKSSREDGVDLIAQFEEKGYHSFVGAEGANDFADYTPDGKENVIALFNSSHMPYSIDVVNDVYDNYVPTLADMVDKGIDVLSSYDDGFVMVVEGGRIDHAAHAQDVAGTIYDTIAFDDAVKVAYDFYLENPDDTLIVVAGDHETGGLGMGFGNVYGLFFDQIDQTKVSIDDTLQNVYEGDRPAFYAYIEENFGLNDLTDDEKSRIETALDTIDNEETNTALYGYYNPAAIAVAHIVAERTNVQFTTFAHTGSAIPLYAIGVGAENFSGFKDNTEVGRAMFETLGFSWLQSNAEDLRRLPVAS